MRYLVVSPPVSQPAQPPAGPFALAAGLCGMGSPSGFLDLSPPFLLGLLEDRRTAPPLAYLGSGEAGSGLYDPHRHRSAAGVLHSRLRSLKTAPGWKVTLMDVSPPGPLHSLPRLLASAGRGDAPYSGFLREYAMPRIGDAAAERVLLSVSYLSQLPAALELALLMRRAGIDFLLGGSMPRSLASSGSGIEYLAEAVPELDLSDGSHLAGGEEDALPRAPAWPEILGERDYLCSRPVIPLPLSTGCAWGRCLFCPDRWKPFRRAAIEGLGRFLERVPPEVMARRPVLHLADSAVPPAYLNELPEVLSGLPVSFYGFARPEPDLLEEGLAARLAEAGCLMLQLGVESGSAGLMGLHRKGTDPSVSLEVLRALAAEGIRTYAYMLLGLPGEEPQDRRLSRELLERAGDSLDFLNLSVFNMPWRSAPEMSAELEVEAGVYSSEEGVMQLYRPFFWQGRDLRREAREFIAEELMGSPVVSAALQRTPRWFRATHTALMDLPDRRRN
ncbi:MAG: hypothetical protein ACQETZ_02855 [Candidatus Fermentibacterota bacterium]